MSRIIFHFSGPDSIENVELPEHKSWRRTYMKHCADKYDLIAMVAQPNQLYRGAPLLSIVTLVPKDKMQGVKMKNLNGDDIVDARKILAVSQRSVVGLMKGRPGEIRYYKGRYNISSIPAELYRGLSHVYENYLRAVDGFLLKGH